VGLARDKPNNLRDEKDDEQAGNPDDDHIVLSTSAQVPENGTDRLIHVRPTKLLLARL
jgi:hypothetical protein